MLHTLTVNIIHDEPVSQPGTYPTSINAHSLDSIFYHHPGIPDSPGAKGDWLVSSHRWSGNERLCIEFPSGKRVLGGGEDPPTTTKKTGSTCSSQYPGRAGAAFFINPWGRTKIVFHYHSSWKSTRPPWNSPSTAGAIAPKTTTVGWIFGKFLLRQGRRRFCGTFSPFRFPPTE